MRLINLNIYFFFLKIITQDIVIQIKKKFPYFCNRSTCHEQKDEAGQCTQNFQFPEAALMSNLLIFLYVVTQSNHMKLKKKKKNFAN